MAKCIEVTKLQGFQRQLRTAEVTQRSKDSSKRTLSTKLEASGIGGALTPLFTIDEKGTKLCTVTRPDDF